MNLRAIRKGKKYSLWYVGYAPFVADSDGLVVESIRGTEGFFSVAEIAAELAKLPQENLCEPGPIEALHDRLELLTAVERERDDLRRQLQKEKP